MNDGNPAIKTGLASLPKMRRQNKDADTGAHGVGGLPFILPEVQIRLCDPFQGRKNSRDQNAGRLAAVQTSESVCAASAAFNISWQNRRPTLGSAGRAGRNVAAASAYAPKR